MRRWSRTRPLHDREIAAAASVLGERAVHWAEVRVATGGWLDAAFAINGGRAFATFHTIHLPPATEARGPSLSLMVHELVHVYQYERAGAVYIPQALSAQLVGEGYDYGGASGLGQARRANRRLQDFNREQQAQIAEDYFSRVIEAPRSAASEVERLAYEPFIAELREGAL